MNKASDKSYISKRVLEKYRKEKEKLNSLQQVKEEKNEDDNIKTSEKIEISSEASQSKVVCIDNENDNDSEHSGEDVDSDDLGDYLDNDVNQVHKQQQVYQQQSIFGPSTQQQDYAFGQQIQMQSQNQFMNQITQPQQQFQMMQQHQPQQQQMQNNFPFQQMMNQQPSYPMMQQQPQYQQCQPQQQQPQQQQPQQQQPQLQNLQFPQNQKFNSLGQQNQKSKTKSRRTEQVDTNVFNLTLGVLEDKGELATGDPVFCSSCNAVFNKYSHLEESKSQEQQLWICNFCCTKNPVKIEFEEIPKTDGVNYIIESAAQVVGEKIQDKEDKSDGISLVFCIDISGSMGSIGYHGDQHGRDKKDNSRIGGVKRVISNKIAEMVKTHPNRKIGLVTFESKIKIIGDGSKVVEVDGQSLDNYDFLLKNGSVTSHDMLSLTVKDSHTRLSQIVDKLQATGGTALGPGLLTAVALAGEGAPGSMVILCTDGEAANGLGAFNK